MPTVWVDLGAGGLFEGVEALLEQCLLQHERGEEAHDVLEQLDSVIIGDPDHCRKKFEAYEAIGTDRMMCLLQFGQIPHQAALRSTELIGEHLIPHFAKRKSAAAE